MQQLDACEARWLGSAGFDRCLEYLYSLLHGREGLSAALRVTDVLLHQIGGLRGRGRDVVLERRP
jgi:hypothetical protein